MRFDWIELDWAGRGDVETYTVYGGESKGQQRASRRSSSKPVIERSEMAARWVRDNERTSERATITEANTKARKRKKQESVCALCAWAECLYVRTTPLRLIERSVDSKRSMDGINQDPIELVRSTESIYSKATNQPKLKTPSCARTRTRTPGAANTTYAFGVVRLHSARRISNACISKPIK